MGTPALDFLRKVEIWQQPGTGGVPVSMPARDDRTLRTLLKECRRYGPSRELETQARSWLIGYRELSPMLNEEQSAELDVTINGQPPAPAKAPAALSTRKPEQQPNYLRRAIVWAAVSVVAFVLAILALVNLASSSHPANPVQHGAQSQSQPKQVQPGTTDLENLESDWGPWRTFATSEQNPQSGAPALLLLNQGGYYASQKWTVPVGNWAWTPDLSGNVSAVNVQGTHALIQDADGNPWTVTIDQPFVFASNPDTILLISPAGDVQSMLASAAAAVRTHL